MDHLNGLTLKEIVDFFRMMIAVGVTAKMFKTASNSRMVARDLAAFWASRIKHELLSPEPEPIDPGSPNGRLMLKNKRVLETVRSLVTQSTLLTEADRKIIVEVVPELFTDETPLDYTGILQELSPKQKERDLPRNHRPQNFEERFLYHLQDPGNRLSHHDIARLYGRGYVWSQLWSRAFGYKRHVFK